MPTRFRQKIENRDLSVTVATNETDTFEFVLTGTEAKILEGKTIIMWELLEDQKGDIAKQVHILAVDLLNKGQSAVDVHYKIESLVQEIIALLFNKADKNIIYDLIEKVN